VTTASIGQYQALLTSLYRPQPNFNAVIAIFAEPFVNNQNVLAGLPALMDIDSAIGDQLDKIGQWVGLSRFITLPPQGQYFSFDIPIAGFDEAPWFVPGDSPGTGLTLDDLHYRLALKAKVLRNQWNGSLPSAYAIWDTLFAGTGYQISIKDNGDLTITLGLLYQIAPDADTEALFFGDYLSVRPSTISIRTYKLTNVGFTLAAAPGAGSASLTFNTMNGVSYAVYQGTSPGGEGGTPIATVTGPAPTAANPTSSVTVNVPGLTTGTTYYFKVVATNVFGQTLTSNEASATPT